MLHATGHVLGNRHLAATSTWNLRHYHRWTVSASKGRIPATVSCPCTDSVSFPTTSYPAFESIQAAPSTPPPERRARFGPGAGLPGGPQQSAEATDDFEDGTSQALSAFVSDASSANGDARQKPVSPVPQTQNSQEPTQVMVDLLTNDSKQQWRICEPRFECAVRFKWESRVVILSEREVGCGEVDPAQRNVAVL